ncbi:MAG: hypothetical protein RLY71_3858 [Pseudomonadota bacterium]|jgi:hypothetical protein
MATTKKAGNPGQAAALPVSTLAQEAEKLERLIDSTRHTAAHELLALVNVAENLADCHRVLHGIELHADRVPSFRAALREACPSTANPQLGINEAGPFELIQNLLRVAGNLLASHADSLEDASEQSARIVRMTKGEQA